MKILHIWDQAGVGCILAKYHRRMGHEVKIIKRAGYDPFGISQFYNEPLIEMDKGFLKYVIREASDYDIIHVHTLYKVIPDLRRKYREKKLVLHYHGSEARDTNVDLLKADAEDKADLILGSTDDLEYFVNNIVFVPNPVDTEHFTPSSKNANNKAFTMRTPRGDAQWVLDYLTSNKINIQVDVIDRDANPIQYAQMPVFLKQYGTCVDIKHINGSLLHAMSKTGLESLACGLSVLDYELKYVRELSEDHKPEVVADRVLALYNAIG